MKQLFDDIVGTPPPSDLDVRAVMRRERARASRNRGVAGVVAFVAVAAAAVVPLTSRTVPTEQPAPPAFELAVGSRQDADATAGRVRAALDAGLAAVGARWRGAPAELLEWEGDRFSGSGTITAAGRDGGLTLEIVSDHDPCPPGSSPEKACGDDQPSKTAALLTCDGAVGTCAESRSGGRRMVMTTDATSPPGAGSTFSSVTVALELGEEWVLVVTASNADARTARQPETVLDGWASADLANEIADRIAA